MKTTLNNLRDYQEMILEIRQLNHALSTYPESVEQLARELKQTRAANDRMETQLAQDREKRENKESYLVMCKGNLEKYEHDLMEVTNQKEYSAVLKEIDSTKREIQETETVILTLMESVQKQEGELEVLQGSAKELEETYTRAVQEFNEENKEKVKRKAQLEKDMLAVQKAIPASFMRKFTQIASRRGGIAVATIQGDCCSACNMKIRPQQINEMKRNLDTLYTCDSCQRILVVKPDADDC